MKKRPLAGHTRSGFLSVSNPVTSSGRRPGAPSPGPYPEAVEKHPSREHAAALAGAVANELNDHLTVILNGLVAEKTDRRTLAAVERASLRCTAIAKGLMQYAHRYGGTRRPASLGALLD